jgi:hypothetical protein
VLMANDKISRTTPATPLSPLRMLHVAFHSVRTPLLGGFTGDGGVLGGDDFPFPVALEPGVSPDETAESFGLPLEFASRERSLP